MAPLQVITVDLLPCLTHLLNDHELGLVLDNALGRRIFVSRDQHKPVALLGNAFVLR